MFAIAGQTAEPNGMKLFKGTVGRLKNIRNFLESKFKIFYSAGNAGHFSLYIILVKLKELKRRRVEKD